jgi:hypothetical protein
MPERRSLAIAVDLKGAHFVGVASHTTRYRPRVRVAGSAVWPIFALS